MAIPGAGFLGSLALGALKWVGEKVWTTIQKRILRRKTAEEQWRDAQRELDNIAEEKQVRDEMDRVRRPTERDASERLRDPHRKI